MECHRSIDAFDTSIAHNMQYVCYKTTVTARSANANLRPIREKTLTKSERAPFQQIISYFFLFIFVFIISAEHHAHTHTHTHVLRSISLFCALHVACIYHHHRHHRANCSSTRRSAGAASRPSSRTLPAQLSIIVTERSIRNTECARGARRDRDHVWRTLTNYNNNNETI